MYPFLEVQLIGIDMMGLALFLGLDESSQGTDTLGTLEKIPSGTTEYIWHAGLRDDNWIDVAD